MQTDSKARIIMGEQYFTAGDYERASQVFIDVLTEDPQNVDALNDAGAIFAVVGDATEAARCYEKALQINPACSTAFFNLIGLLANVGDMELLAEAFLKYENGIPESEEKKNCLEIIKRSVSSFDSVAAN